MSYGGEQPVVCTVCWQPTDNAHMSKVTTLQRNQRWCSDGFEIACDNAERVRVISVLDPCDLEVVAFSAATGGFGVDMAQASCWLR